MMTRAPQRLGPLMSRFTNKLDDFRQQTTHRRMQVFPAHHRKDALCCAVPCWWAYSTVASASVSVTAAAATAADLRIFPPSTSSRLISSELASPSGAYSPPSALSPVDVSPV